MISGGQIEVTSVSPFKTGTGMISNGDQEMKPRCQSLLQEEERWGEGEISNATSLGQGLSATKLLLNLYLPR
jgi:hypothetical protein